MKTWLSAAAVLALLLANGCAAMKVERTVNGNTFVSPYNPTITIAVAQDLAYLGRIAYTAKHEDDEYAMVCATKTEVFFFGEKDERQRLFRLLAIRVLNHDPASRFYFLPNPYEDRPGLRAKGVALLGGQDYPYMVTAMSALGGFERDKEFLTGQGYVLPNVTLAKWWWGCGGRSNRSAVRIEYYEMPPAGCYQPSAWRGTGLVSPCQVEFTGSS